MGSHVAPPLAWVAKAIADATPYDRIEDFAHPLGQSERECYACLRSFRGHPYRSICRLCMQDPKEAK